MRNTKKQSIECQIYNMPQVRQIKMISDFLHLCQFVPVQACNTTLHVPYVIRRKTIASTCASTGKGVNFLDSVFCWNPACIIPFQPEKLTYWAFSMKEFHINMRMFN